MERLQPREADNLAELAERLRVALDRADVVAGGEQMAGIEADTDARRTAEKIDDRRQVLEPVTEIRALSRGVLQ